MSHILTDEFLNSLGAVKINNQLYKIDLACQSFQVGDVVLDRQDGTYATVDMVKGDKFALRDGCAIEIGVTCDRLVKLVRPS
jgi:hypothetical protein